jgi:hypothetical protein
MEGSSDRNGWWWQDHDEQRQWQWAMATQWVARRQSDCNGQWDGSGAVDGTMGNGRLLPMQKQRNGRRRKMEGSGNHDGQHQSDRD